MHTKTVELSVLLSVISGHDLMDVTHEEKVEVVSFIHGKPVEQSNIVDMFATAIEHIVSLHPKLADAAKLIENLVPDQSRYNKLIDLFRKWFDITPIELSAV